MSDFISRSAVLAVGNVRKVVEYDEAGYSMEYLAIPADVIEALPAFDVALVVHAYWIGLEYDGYADGFPVFDTWQCSACGEEFYSEGEPPAYNFCTNCGARMDGEAE